MEEVVIVAAGRTAIGKFGGALSEIPAPTLGGIVIQALLEKYSISPAMVDEVILGEALTAGVGQNPARQAAMYAKIPEVVPSFTVNKVCGSGLKSILLAANAIRLGDADIIVAGGEENMDLSPHLLLHSRKGKRLGNWELADSVIHDGLLDAFNLYQMGVTAENLAEKYKISRELQDAYAFESQMRTKAAIQKNLFAEEIIPVFIPQKKKEPIRFDQDEHPRPDTTLEGLAKLSPSFKERGTVTAGNSTGINDAAAMLIVMSARKAKELGLKPLARIVVGASVGVDPKLMGIGPIPAMQKCLLKANWKAQDVDLIEINESFAVQTIIIMNELGLDPKKVNVNGGAISLGHPIGASGTRLVVTLLYEMIRRDVKRGVAHLCIGGGMGIAMAIER
ncbi:MAG: acetyl-CoA C-acetyltransferase [Chlamydiota bacterium]